jgi:orotate phosphoribosyltransferase
MGEKGKCEPGECGCAAKRGAEVFLAEGMIPSNVLEVRKKQLGNIAKSEMILENAKSIAIGHFVYKSGKHGPLYINKEKFASLDIEEIDFVLNTMVDNAVVFGGLKFEPGKRVRVIGPAYGAIDYSHPVALRLKYHFPETIFLKGRTQLDENGKHTLPQKLVDEYLDADEFVMTEDIVNDGRTLREVGNLFETIFGKRITKAFAIANRGGQTAESALLEGYYPLINKKFDQWDPRIPEELEKINELPEINTVLGKGKGWVETYGNGPYAADMDFSAYPFEVVV